MADEQLDFDFNLYGNLAGNAREMAGGVHTLHENLTGLKDQLESTEKALADIRQHPETFRKLASASKELREEQSKLAGGFKGIQAGFEGAFGFGIIEGINLVKEGLEKVEELAERVAEGLVDIGVEAVNAASKQERLTLSFKLMAGDEGAKQLMEYVEGISKYTELTNNELEQMARAALKAGFSKDNLSNVLPAALDMAAIGGGGKEGAQEAIDALNRIKRGGAPNLRSLAAFGLSEKEIYQRLWVDIGHAGTASDTALKEVEKKVNEGKFSPDRILGVIYDSIANKEHGALGTAGLQASETVEASLHRMQGLPEKYFEVLSKGDGYGKFRGFLTKLADELDPSSAFGQEMQKNISDTFDEIFGDLFGNQDPIEGVKELLRDALELARELAPAFKDVSELVVNLMSNLHETYIELRAVVDIARTGHVSDETKKIMYDDQRRTADKMLRDLQKHPEQLAAMDYAAKKDAFEHSAAGHAVGAKFNYKDAGGMSMAERGQSIGESLAAGVGKGMGADAMLDLYVASFGDKVDQKTRRVLGVHSPSTVFEDIGRMAAAGFAQGLGRDDGLIPGSMGRIPSMGGGRAGGRITIPVEINVIVEGGAGGGDAHALGEEIGSRIAAIAPDALAAALERLAAEQGVDQ